MRVLAVLLAIALAPPLALAALPAADPAASGCSADASTPGDKSRSALPAAADLVYSTVATLRVAGVPITLHARTVTNWRIDSGHYEATLHTSSLEAIEFDQLSRGSLRPGGELAPELYREKRPFHDPESVNIDWDHQRIRFGAREPVRAPEAGAQDRLSLQFALARMYLCQPERFDRGKTIALALIGPRDVDPWQLGSSGEETTLASGVATRATHLSARRKVGSVEEAMDIWLGADAQHFPVRIRMVDRNGSVIDSVLQQLIFPGAAK